MNRYRRIDYEKHIGCHHDDNDELVGGIAIPMVAMYDSEHLTEEEAKEHIMVDEESKYIMLIERSQYDNILRPAVDEAIARAIEESKKPTGLFIGKILYYYDKEEGGVPEKCRVDGFTKNEKGCINWNRKCRKSVFSPIKRNRTLFCNENFSKKTNGRKSRNLKGVS